MPWPDDCVALFAFPSSVNARPDDFAAVFESPCLCLPGHICWMSWLDDFSPTRFACEGVFPKQVYLLQNMVGWLC